MSVRKPKPVVIGDSIEATVVAVRHVDITDGDSTIFIEDAETARRLADWLYNYVEWYDKQQWVTE